MNDSTSQAATISGAEKALSQASVATTVFAHDLVDALRSSHDRLAAAVGPLSGEQVTAGSYCSDWSIAQVLSHLGSGAEIFAIFVQAGLTGAAMPGVEVMQPVWDRWNAMPPQQQASQALSTDADFLAYLDALSDAQRREWRLPMFGSDQGFDDLLRLRLGEHVLHTWDVVVALDPGATLDPRATDLLMDGLGAIVPLHGKPVGVPLTVAVTTERPERSLLLTIGDDRPDLSAAGSDAEADAAIHLPAEALIRLAAGRLDPDHTPPLETSNLELDDLRRAFPGV